MNASFRNLAYAILLAGTLGACGSKHSDSPAAAAAAPTTRATSGAYHGVPIYPGMTELTAVDHSAGVGATLHSGSYRSSDKPEQVQAYYKEQLGKLFGGQVGEQPMGEGMVRLMAGIDDRNVVVLIRTGDSGETIVGIQVSAKD
jgi:hypothetical protein